VSDNPVSEWRPDEPWETEIATLLASLPLIDPPAGFLAKAVDHRPRYALRGTVLLVCGASLAVMGLVRLGTLDRTAVVPAVGELIERHTTTEAALEHGAELPLDEVEATPLSLPGSFEEQGHLEGEEPYQAVYLHADKAVSVFSQPGRVDWEGLPSEGMEDLGGVPAWVDPEDELVLVESADSAVTIVGISPSELIIPLQALPQRSRGAVARLREAAAAISAQLGFADLD
jgi:hypothetical protein